MTAHLHDLLVVGGGPAGAATAYWAARSGLDVVVVEKKAFPRDKTCGDGLTPRGVHQLVEMGLADSLEPFHRFGGLRTIAHGRTIEMSWPDHPVYPDYGYVVRRCDLDTIVAEHAVSAGATLLQSTEALRPVEGEGGRIDGAVVVHKDGIRTTEGDAESTILARHVVVADGANSRFGRELGTARDRGYPMGMAIRTYYESPAHDDPWIESALDVRDRQGNAMPGYGWVFPVGNGTINVGVGLLSTFRDYKDVNTSFLMEEFAHSLPDHWGIDPTKPVQPPTGGRLPMAGSVGPKAGPNWLVVGDAAGAVNPFNGEGIDYAYETGRLAAGLIAEAVARGDDAVLARYPGMLEEEYGLYFKVASLFAKVIGNPALIRELTRVGMRSKPLMEWALRVMANLLRDEERGAAEAAYGAIAAVVRLVPDRLTKVGAA
ncbi:MAG TPA: FAD-dependent oxidoreductase [Acidimicrobiaceae bacterium]|jgi:geranylgeranyl reductase family protein|nr:geranylgeranyl reductase family protein [Actinomycetota bacterium]MEE3212612.1 geranylgeranyl reductase family protein [Actinomycetota bacterium]HBM56707.1 FAD-dependent oxidoreductase [Acidimicrobiaceae bacterium]|tara:strand:+ start:4518 stop:5810 length:1293 start_codon:yes stop_codon:yes gene_type:complete